jgi:competence protein ComEC
LRLVLIALAWSAGILTQTLFPGYHPAFWALQAGLALVLLWISRANPGWRQAWLLATLLMLGALRMALVPSADALVSLADPLSNVRISGHVSGFPVTTDRGTVARVHVDTVATIDHVYRVDATTLLQSMDINEGLLVGDAVEAVGRLTLPGRIDAFSYSDYLARQGVFTVLRDAWIDAYAEPKAGLPFGLAIARGLQALRTHARAVVEDALPQPAAGLLVAILLGDESRLDRQLEQDFRQVGAEHIVAISGFNMAVIAGVSTQLFGLLTRRRLLLTGLSFVTLLGYTLLVGASPGVVRAFVMSVVLMVGISLGRRTYLPASLAATALLLSMLNPTILWDVGFQLSFLAVLGIALLAAPIDRWLMGGLGRLVPVGPVLRGLAPISMLIAASLAAQVMVTPLVVAQFQRFSPLGIPVTLLVGPVQAPLYLLGGSAVLAALVVPQAGQLLLWVDLILLQWTIGVVRAFGSLPLAEVFFAIHPLAVGLFYGGVLLMMLLDATKPAWVLNLAAHLRARRVAIALAAGGVATATLLLMVFVSRPDGRLHVWMLDTGHSHSVLIQTPAGAAILVDGGNAPIRLLAAIGERLPFYKRSLDAVITTQPDRSDIGALAVLAGQYEIRAMASNGQVLPANWHDEIRMLVPAERQFVLHAGMRLETSDGVALEVLHPQSTPGLADSLDGEALVLRLRYADRTMLLTGDINAAGQLQLLASGSWPLAELLVLPKHGREYALERAFLAAVQPSAVILQAEADNRFGDPSRDTLALLGEVPVFRTDQMGVLHFTTDGETWWVQADA